MAPRVKFDKYLSSSVAAGFTDVETFPEIPGDETWILGVFGGSATGKGTIALQQRISTGPDVWETIRAIACPGTFNFLMNRSSVGDGVLRYRIIRRDESGADQEMAAWFEGYKR